MEAHVPALLYNGATTYDATAHIEVELEFVPQPAGLRAAAGTSGGTWQHLRLLGSPSAPVTVLDVTYSGTPPGAIDRAIIKDLFGTWFNDADNLQNFNTVFVSVNLNAKADVDAFQWLQPTFVSYAVAEEGGLPDGIFGVLCMTENRPATGLGHQVSPYAIPAGERSAFLISPERYLSKLLMPGVALMFAKPADADPSQSWPADFFTLEPDGRTITNTAPIEIAALEIAEGDTRVATIDSQRFAVRLESTALVIDITNMRHDYSSGLQWLKVDHTIHSTATASLRAGQKFALEPGDGTHTIVVTKNTTAEWVEIGFISAMLLFTGLGVAQGAYRTWRVGTAATTANTLTQTAEMTAVAAAPEGAAATESAAGATTCLATIRGAATSAKTVLAAFWQNYRATWFALGTTVVGVASAIMNVLELVADQKSQSFLPDFNEFAAGVMAPVQWPSAQSQFTVTAVAFSGGFQAAGNPGFAD
jgi:hypothetical protein